MLAVKRRKIAAAADEAHSQRGPADHHHRAAPLLTGAWLLIDLAPESGREMRWATAPVVTSVGVSSACRPAYTASASFGVYPRNRYSRRTRDRRRASLVSV